MKKIFSLILCLTTAISFAQVSFTYSPEEGCAPMPVQFTNTSPVGNSFVWYIESETYTEENPLITVNPGFKNVTLNVFDTTGGSNTYVGSASEYIELSGVIVNLNNKVCIGEPLNFYCYSRDGEVNSAEWFFGDGNSAVGQEANHSYATAGEFPVTLYVTSSDCGLDTIVNYVTVTDNNPFNDFIRIFGSDEACPNTTVRFDAYFDQELEELTWDFGDGSAKVSGEENVTHIFTKEGDFTVTAYGKNYCGNDTTLEYEISINNDTKIDFIYLYHEEIACPNSEVNFQVSLDGPEDNYTYSWDFGNGKTSAESYPNTTYETVGSYTISLTATNACGNDTTITSEIEINTNKRVEYADAYGPDSICPNDVATFEAYGEDIESYSWNFGDGGTSTSSSPSHQYGATEGTYNVSVKLTNKCGNDTTLLMFVTISSKTSGGNIDFDFFPLNEDGTYCPNDSATFIFLSDQVDGKELKAFFGDGTQSTDFTFMTDVLFGDTIKYYQVKHLYTMMGDYSISLEITNGCGNTGRYDDVAEVEISDEGEFALEVEVSDNNDEEFEVGEELSFLQFSDLEATWDFGDGTILKSSKLITKHTYTSAGSFNLSVTATNGCGFTDTESGIIVISGPIAGINTPKSTLGLTVYPNPTNNLVNFKWDANENHAILNITDLAGKVVYNAAIQNNEQISLEQFKAGFYLYSINVNGVSTSGKLIKQ